MLTKNLLLHWWHYYGKCAYTLEELNKFSYYVDTYGVDKVFKLVMASSITSDGSPTDVLFSIRGNYFDKLITSLPNTEEQKEEYKKVYYSLKNSLIKTIAATM